MNVAISVHALSDKEASYLDSTIKGLLMRNFILHSYSPAIYTIFTDVPEGVKPLSERFSFNDMDVVIGFLDKRTGRAITNKKHVILFGQPEEDYSTRTNVHFAENWWDVYQILCTIQIRDRSWLR